MLFVFRVLHVVRVSPKNFIFQIKSIFFSSFFCEAINQGNTAITPRPFPSTFQRLISLTLVINFLRYDGIEQVNCVLNLIQKYYPGQKLYRASRNPSDSKKKNFTNTGQPRSLQEFLSVINRSCLIVHKSNCRMKEKGEEVT